MYLGKAKVIFWESHSKCDFGIYSQKRDHLMPWEGEA